MSGVTPIVMRIGLQALPRLTLPGRGVQGKGSRTRTLKWPCSVASIGGNWRCILLQVNAWDIEPVVQRGESRQEQRADQYLGHRENPRPQFRSNWVVVEALSHPGAGFRAQQNPKPFTARSHQQQRNGDSVQRPNDGPSCAEWEAVQGNVGNQG
jgi:hypothetical protein